jgi:hypothetical protein
MLPSYPANLRDNRIEWTADCPPALDPERPLRVQVALLEPIAPVGTESGKRMAAAMERLSAAGGLKSIKDGMEWEREQRADREQPGRES